MIIKLRVPNIIENISSDVNPEDVCCKNRKAEFGGGSIMV